MKFKILYDNNRINNNDFIPLGHVCPAVISPQARISDLIYK